MPPASTIPIVLTATIVPQRVQAASMGPRRRREEYLEAIAFYRQFAPVFFLENSSYEIESDAAFQSAEGLQVRHLPVSAQPARGKGFQELEMLDAWIAQEPQLPASWLKITGRYLVQNVPALLAECARLPRERQMLIDRLGLAKLARTHLFWVQTAFYRRRLRGLSAQCDDATGEWSERVFFRALRAESAGAVASFATQPRLSGVWGSTGKRMRPGFFPHFVKTYLRRLNRIFDPRCLWYTR